MEVCIIRYEDIRLDGPKVRDFIHCGSHRCRRRRYGVLIVGKLGLPPHYHPMAFRHFLRGLGLYHLCARFRLLGGQMDRQVVTGSFKPHLWGKVNFGLMYRLWVHLGRPSPLVRESPYGFTVVNYNTVYGELVRIL